MKRIDRVKAHLKEIDKHYGMIKTLQKNCKHKHVEKIPKSDTGNWDKSQDEYWYEITCFDCDKYWTEPQ